MTDSATRPDGGAISRLEAARPSLSASERRIVEVILANPGAVLQMSMAEVADSAGVSDTTVLRACRTAGFAGFTELKLRLAQDLARPESLIHDDVDADDDVRDIPAKVIGTTIASLRDTLELLDTSAFADALALLERASRVLVGGAGASGVVAQAFYQRSRRAGIECDAPSDAQLQVTHAALLGPDDLAIGISTSGQTKSVAEMLAAARAAGARTIIVTANPDSPVAHHADVVLRAVGRETRSEQLAVRASQLALLDALYVAFSTRHIADVLERERRIIAAVADRSF